MAIERTPGFEHFVGRSPEGEHRAMFASSKLAYFAGEAPDGAITEFALPRDLKDAHRNVYLRRIAASPPGEGVRDAFFRLMVEWVFVRAAAPRFWFDCFAHNARSNGLGEARLFPQRRVAAGLLRRG